MKSITWPLDADAALALANTIHGPGGHYRRRASADEPAHDHLDTPERAIEFLGSHGISLPQDPLRPADLESLRVARDAARRLTTIAAADVPGWIEAVRELLRDATFHVATDGMLRATARGWPGLAHEMLPALLALGDEQGRLRHCANPLCTWLFVDRSRNASRVWCEMAVCGNRIKVGRHRAVARSAAKHLRRLGDERHPSGRLHPPPTGNDAAG